MNTDHIFISYARRDGREHAERLDNALQAQGFSTWRDVRNIDPAQDFSAEIETAIERAAWVTVCVTPDSKRQDSFVRREIQYARVIHKPVLPLRFVDIPPHIPIIDNEWIEFHQGWENAFHRLCDILARPSAPSEPAAAAPAPAPLDPFQPYLSSLYQQIVRYLDKTVFTLISLKGQAAQAAVEASEAQVLPMVFWATAGVDTAVTPVPQAFNNFHEAFEQYGGRVLLLGDPGSGKTTTLFAFARDQVARRLEDPSLPVPVIGPLSTWDGQKETPLADWLASQTALLSRDSLSELIQSGRALLMLDGLDELGGERTEETKKFGGTTRWYDPRKRFMDHIPANNQIVVSCRVKDYEEIGKKIKLNGAITLQSLDEVQLREYLKNLPNLWTALSADDELREMAKTPLLLSLFAFAFLELPDEVKQLQNLSRGDLRDKIFAAYVRRRYQHEHRRCLPRGESLTFSLEAIYATFGRAIVRSLNQGAWYGRQNIVTRDSLADALAEDQKDLFLKLAQQLHLLVYVGKSSSDAATGYYDESEKERYRFIHLLLHDYFGVTYALAQIQDADAADRDQAIYALGYLGDVRAAPVIAAALHDTSWDVREQAVNALVNLSVSGEDPRIVEWFVPALDDPQPAMRALAANALGRCRSVYAVESLIMALRDASPDVRVRAVEALWGLRDLRAVQPLIALLEDDAKTQNDFRVSSFVRLALESMDSPEAKAALSRIQPRRPKKKRFGRWW